MFLYDEKRLEALQEKYDCKHSVAILVCRIQADNREVFCWQCQECGRQTGSAVKKSNITIPVGKWSDDIARKYAAERKAEWDKYYSDKEKAYEAQRMEFDAAWWKRYNAYLKTPHWAALRRRVIARDNFQCQACGRRIGETDAHVHHLSYATFNLVGWSLPAECQALCRDCHDRITNASEQKRVAA